MKNILLKYLATSLMLSLAISISAQNLKEDIQKSQEAYAGLENYKGKIISSMITAGGEVNKKITRVYKKGQKFRYDTEGVSVYISPGFLLTYNSAEKLIYCNKSKEEKDFLKQMSGEELMNSNSGYEFMGIRNGQKHYRFYPKDVTIDITDIAFNETTLLVEKITYHYNPKLNVGYERVEMEFRHDTNTAIADSDILYSNFVSAKDDLVKLKSNYRDHELILGPGLTRK